MRNNKIKMECTPVVQKSLEPQEIPTNQKKEKKTVPLSHGGGEGGAEPPTLLLSMAQVAQPGK